MRDHDEQQYLITQHIRRLRQHEHYQTVPIWVIPENNLGLESSHIEKFVTRLPGVRVYHEQEEARAGVRKSQQNTDDYQILFEDMLKKRRMFFAYDLFTVSKGHAKKNGDTTSITNELRDQLERYHWEIKQANDAFGKRRITMTGKMGGAQDDLYISTVMLAFWPKVMQTEARLAQGANGSRVTKRARIEQYTGLMDHADMLRRRINEF